LLNRCNAFSVLGLLCSYGDFFLRQKPYPPEKNETKEIDRKLNLYRRFHEIQFCSSLKSDYRREMLADVAASTE